MCGLTTIVCVSMNKNIYPLEYRPDVDGLRAIAIIFVVLFHAYPNDIPGGYVGVDIFFVISCFLITSIIANKIDSDSFGYVEFYSRRIRRIFPALILVFVVGLLLGWYVLFNDEYRQLGKHVLSGAGFVSNLVLWNESGYFDTASEEKPFLHLWSLGVEEQFYIVWPLLLALAWKWKHNFLPIIFSVAVVSFTLNVFTVERDSVAAFYSPITRFWELMIGGLLAYILSHRSARFGKKSTLISAVGLALILLSAAILDKNSLFPGWLALFPTLGAFLVIVAGHRSWFNRSILSHRVVVFIGLISYPLYLWHWMLLSFARIVQGGEPDGEIKLLAIVASLFLSWVTYKYLELPIRNAGANGYQVAAASTMMLLVGVFGYIIFESNELGTRLSKTSYASQAADLVYKNHWVGWGKCVNKGTTSGCRILDPNNAPDVILIGDSHAGHLASGLRDFYKSRNRNVLVRLSAGCMPFFTLKLGDKDYFRCKEGRIDKALKYAISTDSIDTIILAGYGNLVLRGRLSTSINTQSHYFGYTTSFTTAEINRNSSVFRAAIFSTLDTLTKTKKKIVFVVDVPELYFNPLECVSLRGFSLVGQALRSPCVLERSVFEERARIYHSLVAEAKAAFPAVKFINAANYLCDDNKCNILVENRLLYSTRDHLTTYGSKYLVGRMMPEL